MVSPINMSTVDSVFDNELLSYLVQEVELQCTHAIYAYEQIYTAMGRKDMTKQMESIFFYAHAFLTHYGNVSKLLWPPRKINNARGNALQIALGVTDNSLLSNRTVRDHLEHYDERLEAYLRLPRRSGLIDMAVHIRQLGTSPNVEYHRLFDPSNMTLIYQNDAIGLIGASHALRDLHDAAKKWLLGHNIWDANNKDAWYNQED